MKKIFLLCIACLTLSSFAEYNTFIEDREPDFYTSLSSEGYDFYKKMQSCTPGKFEQTEETVYGKSKNGTCHYSYKLYYNGILKEYHCSLPMKVTLGYASTAMDAHEYADKDEEVAKDRVDQNNEIRKLMLDYCQKRPVENINNVNTK